MPIGRSWDNISLFLAVARAGRFTNAANELGVDHTTVARRMTALEKQFGTLLLSRSPRGVALTEAGQQLLTYAERMEAEAQEASAVLGERDAGISGIVRLATPEAFGNHLVAPNVPALAKMHPSLTLELIPETRLFSLINRDADIAITFSRPPRGRIAAKRLTDYSLGLYASRSWIESVGAIDSPKQLIDQPFVSYIDELLDLPELSSLREAIEGGRVAFRSSSIAAQAAAIANGIGFGFLHVYSAKQDDRLVRILPDLQIIRSYWMAVHADQQRLPRVRAVINFLGDIIATRKSDL